MYGLTEAEYKVQAEPMLRKIFANDDPFRETFSPNIIERVIVYPCDIDIEPPLLDGLIAAASSIGDKGCYLTQLILFDGHVKHCYILLEELSNGSFLKHQKRIEAGIDMIFYPEYVMYSERGLWGVMVSHEHHGMLGGSPEFIEKIHELVPDLYSQVNLFLDRFQYFKAYGLNPKLGWLPGLLTHVYGQEAAERMLQETGLP